MKVLETLVLHGSGWLECADASGLQGAARSPVAMTALQLRLSRAPRDLKLVPQAAGRMVMWRSQPAALRRVVAGQAAGADLTPPAEAAFEVRGELTDPRGIFLPRAFTLAAGGGAGHRLRLYRSSLGTSFGPEGGLQGRMQTEGGNALPWAVLRLVVMPPLATPLTYEAQADAHGEFRLALQRLPTAALPGARYPARLTVRAAAAAASVADPDLLPTARIRTGSGAAPQFRDRFDFDVAPGRVATLASPGQGALVLQLP